MSLADKACGPGAEPDLRYFHFWISYDAERWSVQFPGDIGGQFRNCDFRQGKNSRIIRVLIFFPSQSVHHASENAVGISAVPVVVETPNDKIVSFDVSALLAPHGIA